MYKFRGLGELGVHQLKLIVKESTGVGTNFCGSFSDLESSMTTFFLDFCIWAYFKSPTLVEFINEKYSTCQAASCSGLYHGITLHQTSLEKSV